MSINIEIKKIVSLALCFCVSERVDFEVGYRFVVFSIGLKTDIYGSFVERAKRGLGALLFPKDARP